MKKLHALLLVLGVAFLAYLIQRTGVGELWHELGLLGWGLIPIILSEGVADLFHAVGWRYCLSGPHRSLPVTRLFRIRMAGFAINYLTPTASLGGEVTKAALLAGHHPGPEALSGVLIGKLCFAFGHLLFVVLGSLLVFWRIQLPRTLWTAMLVSSVLLALGMLAFLWIQKHGKLGSVIRWLVARQVGGHGLQKLAHNLTEVDGALKLFYREQPWGLPIAVFWHFLGYSIGIFQTWFFFKLLHQEASLGLAAGAWFIGLWFDLLTFAVPLNLGTLEGTRIIALKALGYDALLGMTYGIAIRLAQLFWAGFGLVTYGLMTASAAKPKAPQSGTPSR